MARAQADCLFAFRLKVSDSQEIMINDARVKFRGRELNYNSDTKAYRFSTLTGCNSQIKGILEVAVRGFDYFKREIEVKGSFLSYKLKLNQNKSSQTAIFEELAVISGIVKDTNEGAIPNTRVILTEQNGKRFETTTNENGYFRLDVLSGKYTLEFHGTAGFAVRKYENFELVKGYKNLDVVLEVRPCDDCEMIESDPVKENKKP